MGIFVNISQLQVFDVTGTRQLGLSWMQSSGQPHASGSTRSAHGHMSCATRYDQMLPMGWITSFTDEEASAVWFWRHTQQTAVTHNEQLRRCHYSSIGLGGSQSQPVRAFRRFTEMQPTNVYAHSIICSCKPGRTSRSDSSQHPLPTLMNGQLRLREGRASKRSILWEVFRM